MLKSLQPIKAAAATNVLAFPARAATATAKAVRRGRKTEGANVLKFTGLTRYNYDRGTLLAKHKESMQETVIKLFGQIVNDEVTGLTISVATGGPGDRVLTTFEGLMVEEYNVTRDTAKHLVCFSERRLLEKGMTFWADEGE